MALDEKLLEILAGPNCHGEVLDKVGRGRRDRAQRPAPLICTWCATNAGHAIQGGPEAVTTLCVRCPDDQPLPVRPGHPPQAPRQPSGAVAVPRTRRAWPGGDPGDMLGEVAGAGRAGVARPAAPAEAVPWSVPCQRSWSLPARAGSGTLAGDVLAGLGLRWVGAVPRWPSRGGTACRVRRAGDAARWATLATSGRLLKNSSAVEQGLAARGLPGCVR